MKMNGIQAKPQNFRLIAQRTKLDCVDFMTML